MQPSPADFVNAAKSLVGILSSLTASGQISAPFSFGANPFDHFTFSQLQGYGRDHLTDHFPVLSKFGGKDKGKERELPGGECGSMSKRLSVAKWNTQPVAQTHGSSESTPGTLGPSYRLAHSRLTLCASM